MGGPFVAASSTRIASSGNSVQSVWPIAFAVSSPLGAFASVRGWRVAAALAPVAGASDQRRVEILLDRSHREQIATRRALQGRLVPVGECGDRKLCADKNQLLEAFQKPDADFVFVRD